MGLAAPQDLIIQNPSRNKKYIKTFRVVSIEDRSRVMECRASPLTYGNLALTPLVLAPSCELAVSASVRLDASSKRLSTTAGGTCQLGVLNMKIWNNIGGPIILEACGAPAELALIRLELHETVAGCRSYRPREAHCENAPSRPLRKGGEGAGGGGN